MTHINLPDNYCPICHKPLASSLGVLGWAGPPFWCLCPNKPVSPVWPNDPQPLDKHYIQETIKLRERVKELEEENKKLKKQVKDYKQAIKQAKASILNAYNNRPRE